MNSNLLQELGKIMGNREGFIGPGENLTQSVESIAPDTVPPESVPSLSLEETGQKEGVLV